MNENYDMICFLKSILEIPWHFPDICPFSEFPWYFLKFPDNSLTLKKYFFPWLFPDAWQPCYRYPSSFESKCISYWAIIFTNSCDTDYALKEQEDECQFSPYIIPSKTIPCCSYLPSLMNKHKISMELACYWANLALIISFTTWFKQKRKYGPYAIPSKIMAWVSKLLNLTSVLGHRSMQSITRTRLRRVKTLGQHQVGVNLQSHAQHQLWISTWHIFHEFHKITPDQSYPVSLMNQNVILVNISHWRLHMAWIMSLMST